MTSSKELSASNSLVTPLSSDAILSCCIFNYQDGTVTFGSFAH